MIDLAGRPSPAVGFVTVACVGSCVHCEVIVRTGSVQSVAAVFGMTTDNLARLTMGQRSQAMEFDSLCIIIIIIIISLLKTCQTHVLT